MLHSIDLSNSPAHEDPPFLAAWLIVRFDSFVPPPHVAEHNDQCPQDDNSQFTRIIMIIERIRCDDSIESFYRYFTFPFIQLWCVLWSCKGSRVNRGFKCKLLKIYPDKDFCCKGLFWTLTLYTPLLRMMHSVQQPFLTSEFPLHRFWSKLSIRHIQTIGNQLSIDLYGTKFLKR